MNYNIKINVDDIVEADNEEEAVEMILDNIDNYISVECIEKKESELWDSVDTGSQQYQAHFS